MTNAANNNLTRRHRYIIAYDISDHGQRRLIHNLLKNHGNRVQYSVFECELNTQQSQQLRAQLCELMAEGDSIRWYPLCQWCQSRLHWSGKGQPLQTDQFYLL